jgi:glycosyltransferase involved in cell wall biosynthesis
MLTSSVVICVYNKEETIFGCLTSLVNQTSPPDEIVIVDDLSTDSSLEVVRRFISTNSNFNFILVANSNNYGPGKSRNIGKDLATKDLLFFLDADDKYEEEYIEKTKYLFSSNCHIKVTISQTLETGAKIIRPSFNKYQLKEDSLGSIYISDFIDAFVIDPLFTSCGNIVSSRDFVKDIYFNEFERNFEDWNYFYKVCLKSTTISKGIYVLNFVGVIYNTGDLNSLSRRLIFKDFPIVPSFLIDNSMEIRFSSYIFYNWIFSTLRRIPKFVNRALFFINNLKYFKKFWPPKMKFAISILMCLLKLDYLINILANIRKKIIYA